MARKTGWADKELASIDLGGERRNNKAKRLLMRFWEKLTESIARASHGWAETMGAYQLENDAFEWHDIMESHWQRTRERMSEGPVVLCIQDTTDLGDFNGQLIDGLEPLNDGARRGDTSASDVCSESGTRAAWGRCPKNSPD